MQGSCRDEESQKTGNLEHPWTGPCVSHPGLFGPREEHGTGDPMVTDLKNKVIFLMVIIIKKKQCVKCTDLFYNNKTNYKIT